MATITDSVVAMIEMPKEFFSADVNSSSLKTESKFSHDQSFGRNVGAELRNVLGSLNDSDTIQARGNSAQRSIRSPQTVHQRLVLRFAAISHHLALATGRF